METANVSGLILWKEMDDHAEIGTANHSLYEKKQEQFKQEQKEYNDSKDKKSELDLKKVEQLEILDI